jgi:DNA helicase MCM9
VEHLILLPGAPDEHTSFDVQCPDLADFDATLSHTLVHFPRLLLPIFEEALVEAQTAVHKHPAFAEKHKGRCGTIKRLCHVRLYQLPPFPELHKQTLSMLRSDEFDHLVQISGTIVRTGSVRVLELSKEYQCMKPRCGHRFRVFADPEQSNLLPTPQCCPAMKLGTAGAGAGSSGATQQGRLSGGSEAEGEGSVTAVRCNSTQLSEVAGSRECIDYQEIRIQDKVRLDSRSSDICMSANLIFELLPYLLLLVLLLP